MKTIHHLVTRINPTLVAVAAAIVASSAIIKAGMSDIAAAMKADNVSLSVQISGNKPVVKAYKVENGELVPVK